MYRLKSMAIDGGRKKVDHIVINSIKVALKNYDSTFWYNFLLPLFDSHDESMTLAERIQTIAEYVKTFNMDPMYAAEGKFRQLY